MKFKAIIKMPGRDNGNIVTRRRIIFEIEAADFHSAVNIASEMVEMLVMGWSKPADWIDIMSEVPPRPTFGQSGSRKNYKQMSKK